MSGSARGMDKGLAVILVAAMGGLIAAQAPINGHLGEHVGKFPAALISFIGGTVLLTLIVVISGEGLGRVSGSGLPWYYFIGGLLGAAYISTVIFTVGTLGAGGITAATIAGQLTAAVALDHFGALGLEQQAITTQRLAGVLLLAAGTYLVVAD
ncbi:MAG: DMT family transporter [Solirubrobacterales bacterium]